jgi:peptide deformylase
VPRAREVVIKALDRRGKPFELALKNYPARVVQHETDHLDGVLFFDRMREFATLTFLDEFQRYWTAQDKD